MQSDIGGISRGEREKARIVLRLFDAAELLGAELARSSSEAERTLSATEYRTSIAQVHDHLEKMQSVDEVDKEFAVSLARAASYIDGYIDNIQRNCEEE
jgi:hypothetical protein